MTDVHISLPPALRRAMDLLTDPPVDPDVSKGYLDLLGAEGDGVPKNTGPIQAAWASPIGSMLYDNGQALSRRLLNALAHPTEWLDIPSGGLALDVGSGPGAVTSSLADAAAPGGLALGVDISEPMLDRAVRNESGSEVGFVRADAQRLPFRDNVFDAAVSMAVLQLIPNPTAALSEMARVLRPGGRLAIMVPTAGRAARFWQMLPNIGAHVFGDDEIGDVLEDKGFASVRVKNVGTFQWVRAKLA
jgi:arsenite methyltransferase